jgi:hypothetical protein
MYLVSLEDMATTKALPDEVAAGHAGRLTFLNECPSARYFFDSEDLVYVQRQHAKRILPMSPSVGSRLPAHAVSMGRVLLAGLPEEDLELYLAEAKLVRLTAATPD